MLVVQKFKRVNPRSFLRRASDNEWYVDVDYVRSTESFLLLLLQSATTAAGRH